MKTAATTGDCAIAPALNARPIAIAIALMLNLLMVIPLFSEF